MLAKCRLLIKESTFILTVAYIKFSNRFYNAGYSMKIVFYNWADYFYNSSRGGGVTVYQKNIINALLSENEIYFISSGEAYNPFRKEVYWIEKKPDRNVRIFEIINSETIAPGHLAFSDASVISASSTQAVWKALLQKIQPDVVHFNNIEGLPVSSLNIKNYLPSCRVIFSLHNYYPFCPTVKLWQGSQQNCVNYNNGYACVTCQVFQIDMARELQVKSVKWLFRQWWQREVPSAFYPRLFSEQLWASWLRKALVHNRRFEVNKTITASFFSERRQQMVTAINQHCDRVLAVSDRVRQLAVGFGIHSEKIQVSYIGTQAAEKQCSPHIKASDGPLTLFYPGYMVAEKGFSFLLDALKALDIVSAKQIKLIVAARNTDPTALAQLRSLEAKFSELIYFDGYSHDQLPTLFASADLTLVPVLWEDNLPQVAIESVCHGVPVLSSDLGGAQELGCYNQNFVFKAGSIPSFLERLQKILSDYSLLETYWSQYRAPVRMFEHIAELLAIYKDC